MAQPSYVSETQILRSVISNPDCRYRFLPHALTRMSERMINAADVKYALMNGQVVLVERKQDDVWRVEGRDIDGNPLVVAAVVYEDIVVVKIITTF